MEKDATIKISLKADSGYSCDIKGRIGLDQWEQINTIIDSGACVPNLHSELETVKEQNKKLTDCVNAGIELAKSAETVSSSLEKAIELLKDAELCLEVQLQDVISRGALAALLQRIKSGTTFLEGK